VNRLFVVVPALVASMVLQAQNTHHQYPEYGELLYARLSSAPFPHPLRASGHTYGNQRFPADKHYGDSSVAIFIRSDLAHDMVMNGRMQYRDYLKASGLPNR
jgi:hypothetical protein